MMNNDFRVGIDALDFADEAQRFARVSNGVCGVPRTNENSGIMSNSRARCAIVSVCSVVMPFCISLSVRSEPDSAPKKIMAQPAFRIAAIVASE